MAGLSRTMVGETALGISLVDDGGGYGIPGDPTAAAEAWGSDAVNQGGPAFGVSLPKSGAVTAKAFVPQPNGPPASYVTEIVDGVPTWVPAGPPE